MKIKTIYIYYLVLVLFLALWGGTSALPMPIRLAYLALTIAPLFKYNELIPAVFACALILSHNSFTEPVLPTEDKFFMVILAGLALITNRSKRIRGYIFIVSLLYILLVDMVTQGHTSRLFSKTFICILTYLCVRGKMDECKEPLKFAFIICAIVLSYWTLFRLDARMRTIHEVEGLSETAGWTDPNYLGCIIGLGCVIAINELITAAKKGYLRIVYILTIVLSLFALAYLASRGAILAVAASAALLFSFSKSAKRSRKILFVVAMAGLLLFMYQSSALDALEARFQSDTMATGTGRTEIWAIKLKAFFSEGNLFNYLFGFGQEQGFLLGNFGRARAFHNDFIAFLVEYGFIGLFLFLMVLYYPIKRTVKQYRNTIIGLMAVIFVAALTLEPMSSDMPGSIAFTYFLFYIITEYISANKAYLSHR